MPLDGGGFGYAAFCVDAYAGLIAGWECSLSKETPLVERAIRQAIARREREGRPVGEGAIHHSDAGSPSQLQAEGALPEGGSPSPWSGDRT